MYMLRAISGVLHQEPGPAVSDAALDLRLGELAVVVPLVVCLLGLSAWPNLISGHAFGGNHGQRRRSCAGARQVIVKPHVDWFAISPSLSLLAAAGAAADGRGLRPGRTRARAVAAFVGFAGFVGRVRLRSARRRAEPGRDDDRRTTRSTATAGRRSRRS